MTEPHVVTGLISKRAELAGQLEHHQAEVRRLMIDLDNLDCTLRLFSPDIDLERIRPKPLPPRHAAYKGEISRLVLDTLRQAGRPMTGQELAQHVIADRGMNTADKRLVMLIGKRVGACLRHHRKAGRMQSIRRPGDMVRWTL